MQRYQSPFSWRYSSPEMRTIWSEEYKRRAWRKIWLALAEVQAQYGLISEEQLADLRSHVEDIDLEQALALEAEIHHDLMAELKTYAAQCPLGGGALHLGATSMDIEDNADAIRIRTALALLLKRMADLLEAFAQRIEETARLPVIGFTHLQPAEPTTLGYRLASYAQDLLALFSSWQDLHRQIRGKGFKGAVGTAASYLELLGEDVFEEFERRLSEKLDLEFYTVTAQTYPRMQDYRLVSELAGAGAVINKFAFDLRLLQSPPLGEWQEPFATRQVGSSAMPFKRNPISAEKIDSLARALSALPQIAWGNAAHSLLERTLDDSANRRSLLPETFLICDEILSACQRLVSGMTFDLAAISRNLQTYAPFAATERVLMALVRTGADRQVMHERLREHALTAWQVVKRGEANPMTALILQDPAIRARLSEEEIHQLMNIDGYTGIAAERSLVIARQIRAALTGR